MRLYREFIYLLRDLFVVLPLLVISLLLVFRARSLVKRLRGIQEKRVQRKEVQMLNVIRKIRIIGSGGGSGTEAKENQKRDGKK